MEFSITDFLQKLESEGKVLPQIRNLVQEEINKYAGMRLVLENTQKNKEFTQNLLAQIDDYLLNLSILDRKFRHTFLALVRLTPEENPAINPIVLRILKSLNTK